MYFSLHVDKAKMCLTGVKFYQAHLCFKNEGSNMQLHYFTLEIFQMEDPVCTIVHNFQVQDFIVSETVFIFCLAK